MTLLTLKRKLLRKFPIHVPLKPINDLKTWNNYVYNNLPKPIPDNHIYMAIHLVFRTLFINLLATVGFGFNRGMGKKPHEAMADHVGKANMLLGQCMREEWFELNMGLRVLREEILATNNYFQMFPLTSKLVESLESVIPEVSALANEEEEKEKGIARLKKLGIDYYREERKYK